MISLLLANNDLSLSLSQLGLKIILKRKEVKGKGLGTHLQVPHEIEK